MTVQEAYSKIEAVLEEYAAPIRELGLDVKTRIFYTDKNLRETPEFTQKCIILFGDIAIGMPGMEREDYCNYSVCTEIKTAEVNEEELDAGLATLSNELSAFTESLSGATSAETVIRETARAQEQDAERAAAEFTKEMKKIRLKMILALGVIIVIMLGIIIGGSFLK